MSIRDKIKSIQETLRDIWEQERSLRDDLSILWDKEIEARKGGDAEEACTCGPKEGCSDCPS